MIPSDVMWRSVTIAMAVAGVVLVGILYAIGSWGVCCGPAISKPITGDATWARPSNPFGQFPAPAKKADHGAKTNEGASGASANPVGTLAALKRHGQGPSQPRGTIPTGDTGQSESPLPPSGGSGNTTPTNNCSPVLDVLAGIGLADCAPEAGASDHNDSSGKHGSSGNGNHHSSNQGDSSGNANADATALANLPAAANDDSNGSDHGHHNGSEKGKKDHGASSQDKSHGNKHH